MIDNSPDQILIQRVKQKLIHCHTLDNVDIDSLIKQIASGNLKSQDWMMFIENTIDRRNQNESSEEA